MNYTFRWHCEGASGSIVMLLSDKDIELIEKARKSHFDRLEDCSYLEPVRKRLLRKLPFYNPRANQDIRIFLPETKDEEK